MRSSLCLLAVVWSITFQGQQPPPRDAARVVVLKPARVFDGNAMHEGWAVRVSGDRIDAAGPADGVSAPGGRSRRAAGHDAAARPDRRALPRPAASLQRSDLERSGAQGVARPAHGARREPPARHAHGRVHDHPRSRHRRRRLRGRRAEAGRRGQIVPGPRMLVTTRAIVATGSYGPKGFALEWRVPQGAEEADGAGSGARGPRPDRPRRRLDQGLRRLPLGRARRGGADVLGRGAARRSSRRRAAAGVRSWRTRARRRACGARCWPASRRSSTATTAPPRCSS